MFAIVGLASFFVGAAHFNNIKLYGRIDYSGKFD